MYTSISPHLESLVFWVDGHSSVSQHGLDTSGSHDDLLIAVLHRVGKEDEDSKLNLLVVAGHSEKSSSRQLYLVNLKEALFL